MDDKKMTDAERHERAAHAVQTGVAYEMEFNRRLSEPKHLRTGINMAMSDQAGLARLLIEKGVITHEEYCRAVADEAEREKERAEARLEAHYGTKFTLR